MKGILSVSVPALLDGWLSAQKKYGSLSLAEVFAPAIDLAANGFPTSHVLAKAIAADPLICEFPTSKAVFSRGGRPLRPGEILYQRDLGRTFQVIVDGGADAFYRGEIARKIAEALRITLTRQEEEALADKPTDSLQAYDLYLRGKSYARRLTRQDLEFALQMFENAVSVDPSFALAHAAIANACAKSASVIQCSRSTARRSRGRRPCCRTGTRRCSGHFPRPVRPIPGSGRYARRRGRRWPRRPRPGRTRRSPRPAPAHPHSRPVKVTFATTCPGEFHPDGRRCQPGGG